MAGKPIDNTDHYFTRMCDVREEMTKERDQIFKVVSKFFQEEVKKQIEKERAIQANTGKATDINELSTFVLELESRIKALEKLKN